MKVVQSILLASFSFACLAAEPQYVSQHNLYRKKHGAGPLKYDSILEAGAKQWADNLAPKGCRLSHTDRSILAGKGENLHSAWSSNAPPGDITVRAITKWYNEVDKYDFKNPLKYAGGNNGFNDIGHFMQVVYSPAKSVGCAASPCTRDGMTGSVVVCRYDQGTMIDQNIGNHVKPAQQGA